jgi:hypothetical protein
MRPGASLLVAIGAALLMLAFAIITPADVDLWGHLKFGGDIVAAGTIPRTDPYSFTSDRTWVNHEWLAEVIFDAVYRVSGSAGLIVSKVLAIAAVLAMGLRVIVRAGVPVSHRIWLIAVLYAGTYWRTHSIRPQLFSVVLFAVMVIALDAAARGRRRWLLTIPPLFAIWVNLHGGWIVGAGVFAIWVVLRVARRGATLRDRTGLLGIAAAAALATTINPYGWGLWAFLAETVRFNRQDIQDWSPVMKDLWLLALPWACVTAVALAAVWRRRTVLTIEHAVIVVALGAAAFRVSRLDAFFTIAVVMWCAGAWASPAGARATDGVRPLARAPRGALAITALMLAAIAVPAVRAVSPYAGCVPIAGEWAPDLDASRFIAQNDLRGRLLTWFDWGEYVIWQFGPRLQVSIDGRRETVYSEMLIDTHRSFYAGEATPALVRDLDVDYAWLPSHIQPETRLLPPDWIEIFRSVRSAIFARRPARTFTSVTPAPAPDRRCFPGP